MTQDQIREKLQALHSKRGYLSTFCRLSGLPFQRAWRFANNKVSKLSLADGETAKRAFKKQAVKALLVDVTKPSNPD